jgi:tRNA threonylcarbamoyladenosine biosynthesis protein TsaE
MSSGRRKAVARPATRQASRRELSAATEADLRELARSLARELRPGARVLLEGPLGAGKSTFARFLLEALAVDRPAEGSPTFAIAHEYLARGGAEVIHLDLYRLRHEGELEAAGVNACFWERDAVVVAEWSSRFPELVEALARDDQQRYPRWEVRLDFAPEAGTERRRVVIVGP